MSLQRLAMTDRHQIDLLKKQLACANAQADLFAERYRETLLALDHANTYIAELENHKANLDKIRYRVKAVPRLMVEGYYPGELVYYVDVLKAIP